MKTSSHAIIGAGLAGLACARRLHAAGQQVEVFEKSRGAGGRLSSRRRLNTTFDLGCQQLNAVTPEFIEQLALWQNQGWVASDDQSTFYGSPRMSGLTRQLSSGLKLHLAKRIVLLHKKATDWWLEDQLGDLYGPYQQVTLALPAAQALPLIKYHSTALSNQLEQVEQSPSWVAYFALPEAVKVTNHTQTNSSAASPLRRWTLLNTKPEQEGELQKWVVEASTQWSKKHLNLTQQVIADKLFALWCNDVALSIPKQPLLLEAHRWLYAFTAKPLNLAYLQDSSLGINLCGDYCSTELVHYSFANQAEAAWLSGDKLGQQLVKLG
ncbi:NAD(P)/FAD-dependent oxidoreductase [Marinospirillum insulare]|uniref:Amine oxidase domain-containing protein n=1 Tax=Marinospirillum insulare TaxID=217169 RepID=A0ABQ5ZYS1_9GAMM|nr:FAD-dependent oxidoreductase [Marinospirillum insulare]GLR64167.1 hypothetical protein GCM10007878_16050 [Marinospirillum insulare]